ncbi:DNA glycosylase AlkZ-like family protein, partial [Vibrio parahaemolyticus]
SEAIPELIRRAAVAYGVATAADLADYWRISDRPAVLSAVRDLVDAGELEPVSVEGWTVAGRPAKAWLHRDAARPRRIDAT